MAEERLVGGVGHGGLVVRVGDTVRRPWHPSTPAIHALLRHLHKELPGAAPVPLGRDDDGREVLTWIQGDVAVPPFPGWATDQRFLGSVGHLLRQVHDVVERWHPPGDAIWAPELADPEGGSIVVHADVRPENVIAHGGEAAAIIDWEFAAPGRRIWDVVSTARFCVPFTAPSRRDPAYRGLDPFRRLRLFLDEYGLGADDRAIFTRVLEQRRLVGERFVRSRIARGEPAFVGKWANAQGEARFKAEQEWVSAVPADVALY